MEHKTDAAEERTALSSVIGPQMLQTWRNSVAPCLEQWISLAVNVDDEFDCHQQRDEQPRLLSTSWVQKNMELSGVYRRAEKDTSIVRDNIFRVLLVAEQLGVSVKQPMTQFLYTLQSALDNRFYHHNHVAVAQSGGVGHAAATHRERIRFDSSARFRYLNDIKHLKEEYDAYILFMTNLYAPILNEMEITSLGRTRDRLQDTTIEFATTLASLRWTDLTRNKFWQPDVRVYFESRHIVWPWLGLTRQTVSDSWLADTIHEVTHVTRAIRVDIETRRKTLIDSFATYISTTVLDRTLELLTAHHWEFLSTILLRLHRSIDYLLKQRPSLCDLAIAVQPSTTLALSSLLFSILAKTCESEQITAVAVTRTWIREHEPMVQDAQAVAIVKTFLTYLIDRDRSVPTVAAAAVAAVSAAPSSSSASTLDTRKRKVPALDTWTLDDLWDEFLATDSSRPPPPRAQQRPSRTAPVPSPSSMSRTASVSTSTSMRSTTMATASRHTYQDRIEDQLKLWTDVERTAKQEVYTTTLSRIVQQTLAKHESKHMEQWIQDLEFMLENVKYLLTAGRAPDANQQIWLRTCKTFLLRLISTSLKEKQRLSRVQDLGLCATLGTQHQHIWLEYMAQTMVHALRWPTRTFGVSSVSEIQPSHVTDWITERLHEHVQRETNLLRQYGEENSALRIMEKSLDKAKEELHVTLSNRPNVKESRKRLLAAVSQRATRDLLRNYVTDPTKMETYFDTDQIFEPMETYVQSRTRDMSFTMQKLQQHHWDVGVLPCPDMIKGRVRMSYALSWVLKCSAYIMWTVSWS